MEDQFQPAQQPDYHQYDRVLEQTAPDLPPYGSFREPQQPQPDPVPPAVLPPYRPPVYPPQVPENQLPGGIRNPCCMGTEALGKLNVLTGFIEEELIDKRYFRALACRAPAWARAELRDMGEEAAAHARELQSVCYMITGQCYRPMGISGEVYIGAWCPALRERYHTEACSGLNYARAAEETVDPCLREILERLSREEYHRAQRLLQMLERSMQC